MPSPDLYLSTPRGSWSGDGGARTLRERHRAFEAELDRAQADHPPFITARRLVQVYDAGHMPTSSDHIFACNPVELDGSEAEGQTYTPVADTGTTLFVDVLGGVPAVGDLLKARAVGGRWVAELRDTPATPTFPCGSCGIPKANLTVSWSNGIIGNGSTRMGFTAPSTWISACTNQLLYQILCNAGQVEFRVIYFISGACPTGQSNYCSTLGNNPLKLTQTSLTCGDAFLLACTVGSSGCPNLYENGYTGFTVSE